MTQLSFEDIKTICKHEHDVPWYYYYNGRNCICWKCWKCGHEDHFYEKNMKRIPDRKWSDLNFDYRERVISAEEELKFYGGSNG